MELNDLSEQAAASNAPDQLENLTSLTTVPQTIFGPKTLLEGRIKAFASDLRKLVTMTIQEFQKAQS